MKNFILQEKYHNYQGDFWFDITKSDDIEFIYKLKKNYELKNGEIYRVVIIYE